VGSGNRPPSVPVIDPVPCRGKVCLPVAEQCSTRQSKVGATTFQNKTYWISWHNDEQVKPRGETTPPRSSGMAAGTGSRLATTAGSAAWTWCPAHCLLPLTDPQVSFETEAEWQLVKGFMSGAGVREIWTAGRLCDSEVSGCEADHYKPLPINGWFWASTLIKVLGAALRTVTLSQMLPTNRPIGLNPDGVRVIGVNEWAQVGCLPLECWPNPTLNTTSDSPRPEPRGSPSRTGSLPPGGWWVPPPSPTAPQGEEPCMAVIDGAWHDTSCNNRSVGRV
jgi:hypothetical protein